LQLPVTLATMPIHTRPTSVGVFTSPALGLMLTHAIDCSENLPGGTAGDTVLAEELLHPRS